MAKDFPVPETRVLAIASHVVYGYVGNTMATFVMQALGCDVAALNTVQFSNHTGYKQFKGTRFDAEHIRDLYAGLKQSYLTDFDTLLSGYAPSAEAVEAVGYIARDLRYKSTGKPGSFFWVLDPVMGDQGRLYVNENVVPAYKQVIRDADLILPNQFEAETLTGIKITDIPTLTTAIDVLHTQFSVPHVIVTSIRFPPSNKSSETLTVIGSSRRTDSTHRLFKIEIPSLNCFFSGTGDLFAALTVVRLREESTKADLLTTKSWMPADEVSAADLPLARAVEKVLASMQKVLEKTMNARQEEIQKHHFGGEYGAGVDPDESQDGTTDKGKRQYLAETKASEVRLIRNVEDLKWPGVKFTAEELDL